MISGSRAANLAVGMILIRGLQKLLTRQPMTRGQGRAGGSAPVPGIGRTGTNFLLVARPLKPIYAR